MKSTEIYALVSRILSDEADRQDHQRLQQWLEEAKENRAMYEGLRQIWQETSERSTFSNADRVYHQFLEKRDSRTEHRAFPAKKTQYWKKVSVAAIFILIGGLSYWWLETASVLTNQPIPPATIAEVVKENPAGQKSKIVLADGTIVWLNSESTLRYPASFSDTIRQIELIGEAYFQVAKDGQRPFVVASGGLQTTAVGTAFNVRHYAGDSVAIIYLAEGEVKIENMQRPGTFVFLVPGWGVSSVVGSTHLQKFADTATRWAGWKDGVLFFENADLQEVIETCERWYSVDVILTGTPPQDWKFTGKFKNENLENVLESMRYGRDFDYTIQDKQVELNFKKQRL
ncbi:MAG: FecR domain-containing protein [Cyclobacteriaceae bacterium]